MSSIVCSNLSFAWPDDTPLFDRSVVHRRRRPHRAGRTQRRRQEHAAQADRRRIPAHRGSVTVEAPSATCRRRCRSSRPHRGRRAGRRPGPRRARRRWPQVTPARTSSPRSATTGTSRSAPVRSLTVSALATSPLTDGWARCPAARSCRSGWRRSCSSDPMCCCSTSRPTTSTSTRGNGSTTRWTTIPDACCWSATTGCCWTGWTASPSCITAKCCSTEAISACTNRRCRSRNRSRRRTCATPSSS